MEELYHAGPNGLCGNEDMGQMSAWYVFSAMGFILFARGKYLCCGSPSSKVTLHLDKKYYPADRFGIEAVNNSKENKYISRPVWMAILGINRGSHMKI